MTAPSAVEQITIFTKPLAKFLFSKSFFDGWQFVPVLLAAFLFQAMSSYLGTIYTSAKKTKMLFISTVIAAIANIALNAILIPIFGAQGAAIATFVSYFIIWIIRLIDTRKIIRLEIAFRTDIVSYLLLGVQIGIAVCNSPSMYLYSSIIFALLVVLNIGVVREILAGVRIKR